MRAKSRVKLKRSILRSLRKQGYTVRKGQMFLPPEPTKDDFRQLNELARQKKLQLAEPSLRRYEDRPAFTWPVLEGDDARCAVRAVIDAVVADAYCLDRKQYEHVLRTFSHASYPKAPELCLAAYDELKAIGLEAFTKKHDPYWDILLNENLPKPVIDLPISAEEEADEQKLPGDLFRQKDGQSTFIEPGPLFEGVKAQNPGPTPAPSPKGRRGRKPKADTPEATKRDYQELLAALRNRGELTSADAQELLGLPAATLRPMLKPLVEEGFAVKEGKGRGTTHRTGRRK